MPLHTLYIYCPFFAFTFICVGVNFAITQYERLMLEIRIRPRLLIHHCKVKFKDDFAMLIYLGRKQTTPSPSAIREWLEAHS
jgi:hypothetical protein